MPEDADLLTLADCLGIVRRRWLLIVTIAIAGSTLAAAIILHRTRLAEASAGLALQRTVGADNRGQDQQPLVTWANTQRDQLMSRQVLEQVLASGVLSTNTAYRTATDPVALLARRVNATAGRQSWYVTVTLQDEDPGRAEAALGALLTAFRGEQERLLRERSAVAIATLTAKAEEAAQAVARAQETERRLREERGLVAGDPDRNPASQRLGGLIDRLAAVDDRRTAQQSVIDLISNARRIENPALRRESLLRIERIAIAPAVSEMFADWRRLRVQEAAFAAKYGDLHPRMVELRQQIEHRRLQIDDAIAIAIASAEGDLAATRSQREALAAQVATSTDDLATYRRDLDHLRVLTQETAAAERVRGELAVRLSQERAAASLAFSELLVPVDPPRASWDRSDPTRLPLLAAAVLGTLAAALAAAVGWDLIDGRNLTPRTVARRTGRPVLVTIPFIAGVDLLHDDLEPPALMEAFRVARQALLMRLRDGTGSVLCVVSPCRGDARSLCAARLARVFAGAGAQTLLVDADLRRSALSARLGAEGLPGLSDLLAGSPGIAPREVDIDPHLGFMPAGAEVEMPGDLMHSHCLAEWLGQMRGRYDLVVLDTPPLGEFSDALVCAAVSDVLVLALRPGGSSAESLEEMLARLGPLRDRLAGTLLGTPGQVQTKSVDRDG